MAKLESLIVDLTVETAQLRAGLDKAKGHVHSFGESIKEVAEKIEGLVAFEAFKEIGKTAIEAGEMLSEFIVQGAEAADKMGKLAAAAQVPVETFQRLSYAAKLGGLSSEDLAGAFNKLNQALGEAEQGTVKQVALFQALGVSLKDNAGHARSSADIFQQLAGKLGEMGPGFAKARLEQELFGKSGTQLESTLKEVAEGMANAGGAADQFGLVLDARAIKAATEFHDNVEKIKAAAEGVATRIAGNLSPALNALTDEFLRGKTAGEGLTKIVDGLSDALKAVVTVAVALKVVLEATATAVGGGVAAAFQVLTGHFSRAKQVFQSTVQYVASDFAHGMMDVQKIWFDAGKVLDDLQKGMKGFTKATEDANDALKKQKAAEDYAEALKKVNEFIAGYAEKLEALKGNDSPIAELEAKLANGPIADAFKKLGKDADAFKDKVRAIVSDLESLKLERFQSASSIKIEAGNVAQDKANQLLRQGYNDVLNGTNAGQAATRDTAGFASFDAALAELAKQTDVQARALAVSEGFKIEKDDQAAAKYQAIGDAAGEAKDKALKAAEGFKKLAEIQAAAADLLKQKILAGIEQTVGAFTSKMGDFGQVVSSGIQGFKSGGVWGAIVAVVAELISKIKDWQIILDVGNGLIKEALADLAGAFSSIITGLRPLLGALGRVFHSINGVLAPILELIGNILGGIAPLFEILGMVLEPLGGIFKSIGSVLDAVLKPVLFVIIGIFEGIGEVMLGFQLAVNAVWLALVTAGDEILKAFGNHSLTQARDQANAGLKATVDQMIALGHMDPNKLKDQADADAAAAEELGKTTDKATAAIDKWASSITNAPQGFRIDALRFNSTAAQSSLAQTKGDIHVHVNGGVMTTVDQITEAVAKGLMQRRFHKHGI